LMLLCHQGFFAMRFWEDHFGLCLVFIIPKRGNFLG